MSTESGERPPRGEGDMFRAYWLQGDRRPPFCDSPTIGGGNRGCRYCWQDTCNWDTNHPHDTGNPVPVGRHRATVQPQSSLLASLRRRRRKSTGDSQEGAGE